MLRFSRGFIMKKILILAIFTLISIQSLSARENYNQIISKFYHKYKGSSLYCKKKAQAFFGAYEPCIKLSSLNIKIIDLPNPYSKLTEYEDGKLTISFDRNNLNQKFLLEELYIHSQELYQ